MVGKFPYGNRKEVYVRFNPEMYDKVYPRSEVKPQVVDETIEEDRMTEEPPVVPEKKPDVIEVKKEVTEDGRTGTNELSAE